MPAFKLIVSIVLCLAAGFIGSIFTRSALPVWYAGLAKPSFNPPPWLFGPVWTLLYILMGIALYLVWKKGLNYPQVQAAFYAFGAQLALNVLWSYLFFGLRSPLAGLIDIVLLWAAIIVTMVYFYRISQTAVLLLVPYLLWVSFAAVLNFRLWQLNA